MKEFNLNGVIVCNDDAWIYDWLGMDCTSPAEVKDFLTEADGDDVQININSGGGDLYSGVNIHDMLENYAGKVTVKIMGLAASAASIVAMAGECFMSPGSTMMIHNVSCQDYTDKNGKTKTAKMLNVLDKSVAAVYEAKSGMAQEELLKLMDKETWLDAKTALEMGLIDGILTDTTTAPRVAASVGSILLPQKVIDELRQIRQKDKVSTDGVPVEQLKKRLELLRR